jgi:hypothetical protein
MTALASSDIELPCVANPSHLTDAWAANIHVPTVRETCEKP